MSLDYYLNWITAEHADKPKFVAMVRSLVLPFVESQSFFAELLTDFDIDTAVGVQLDAVGEWVGRSRKVATPLTGVFFSLDTLGLGFDQGNWKGPFDPDTGVTLLDDETYRLLLKSKIIMNSWDGSIAVIASALTELFGNSPNTIISVQDNQDMTMTVSVSGQVPNSVTLSLLEGGYVPINPSGVKVNYIITSVNTAALFGFDAENSTVAGFDVGSWGGQPGVGPAAPTGFALVIQSTTSASFSWIAPQVGTGPITYQLQYQVGTGTSGTWILAGVPVFDTTGTISGLQPGTTYTAEVYAINSSGSGPASSPITFTTAAGVPLQVTGLQSPGQTSTSISLSWNTVVGNNIVYQVQFRQQGVGSFVNYNGTVVGTSTTVNGLTQDQTYEFQVFATNSAGAGPTSAILTVATTGPFPGVIQNLHATSAGQTDVALAWDQPITNNGPYTYLVQYAQNVNPIVFQNFTGNVVVTASGGSCDVTGLTSGLTYLFQVTASNSGGRGPVSGTVSVTTAGSAPAAPASLTVTAVTDTTVGLSWPIAAGAQTYQIQSALVATGAFADNGVPTNNLTGTATGLQAGVPYTFVVVGINSSNNRGPASPAAAAVTTGILPGQVGVLVASNPTNNSIILQWNPPTTGTGSPAYQVQYKLGSIAAWSNAGAPIDATTKTVGSLQSGLNYNFQVFAINNFGVGPPSTITTANTTSTPVVVTWSPTDHTSDLVLSNSNLTATSTTPTVNSIVGTNITTTSFDLSWTAPTAGAFFGARGTNALSTGQAYIEFNLKFVTTDFAIGLANSSWNLSSTGLSAQAVNLPFVTQKTPVIAPLIGSSVAKGAWFGADLQNGPVLPSGKQMHYSYLLPDQYDPSFVYPVLVHEHIDLSGNEYYFNSVSISATTLPSLGTIGYDYLPFLNTSGNNSSPDDWYNNVDFRTNYPCIVVLPYCDQTSNDITRQNFGGQIPPGDHGVNEDAVVACVQAVLAAFSADSNRVYITGDAQGGAGTWALMMDYNTVNGPFGRVFAAGAPFAGYIERNGRGTGPGASDLIQLHNVPVFAVSGNTDPNKFWNEQVWETFAGTSDFPDSLVNNQAGSSKFNYLEDPLLGTDTWSIYRSLPNGSPIWDWLFAQIAQVPVSVSTGLSLAPSANSTPLGNDINGLGIYPNK